MNRANAPPTERPQPHAVLDLPSRKWKGEKIARLLGVSNPQHPMRVLEVGTGSGGIAHWFGTHASGMFDVDAVDVVDSRQIRDGYRFQAVDDARLPFPDGSFDLVLSNHVIEHVGSIIEQRVHLAELRRVIRPAGKGYLAVPNRWMLVEPHFRLPFLSWVPEGWRSPYVRMAGRGAEYDCRPLTAGRAQALIRDAGFLPMQHCANAIRLTYEIESPQAFVYRRLLSKIPDSVLDRLGPVIPTLIYSLDPV